MKHYRLTQIFSFAILMMLAPAAFSQSAPVRKAVEAAKRDGRLPPDNTVRYPDGSVRYPDGTIYNPGNTSYPSYPSYPSNYPRRNDNGVVYPDGSVHYPNGKIVYADGTVRFPNGAVRYPDGRIQRPDGTVYYPNQNDRYDRNLPPGQAKKLYGKKSARDFAPGHQKKHYDNDNWGHGKKHKGKKH